jgi:sirohydrochlorin ferrochelatase
MPDPVVSDPVVLVAHGSRDPRAGAVTRALARTVAAVRPGLDVHVAFLEHTSPSPAQVLASLPGPAVVVPLLLTNAFHGSVDLPAQVAGFDCVVTGTLGAVSPLLLEALIRRLPARPFDSLVLAAAGTRVVSARAGVDEVAAALSERLNVPCRVAYAAGASPSGEAAARSLPGRTGVASYFLAPGKLHDLVVASALAGGATFAAAPLGASWPLAELICARIDAARAETPQGSLVVR